MENEIKKEILEFLSSDEGSFLLSNFCAPIGSIVAYAGPGNKKGGLPEKYPIGWLLCSGQQLDPKDKQYNELFKRIGTRWGGDGVNSFFIPDLRGKFLRGVDHGANVDKGKRTSHDDVEDYDVGTYQADAIKSHKHNVLNYNGKTYKAAFAHKDNGYDSDAFQEGNTKLKSYSKVTDEGIDLGNETRPVNAAVNWIIRYK